MSRRGSWGNTYKLWSFLELFYRYRSFSVYNISRRQHPRVTVAKLGHGYSMHRGLHLINSNIISDGTCRSNHPDINMVKDDKNKDGPPAPSPTPPRFNFAIWARWLLGSVLSLLLPLWKQKWEKLKKIEGETEMVIGEVENVAEVVEKVANVTEKLSADVADILPDHTKLKETALLVERVSKETAHDAQLTLDYIHKIDKLEKDLNDLETLVEPIVDKILQHESKVTHKNGSLFK